MPKVFTINYGHLPLKLHYVLFFGGLGGATPYLPLLAKGIGITATAVGLINTIQQCSVFFSKPFFGFLTDYFKNIKCIVFILICVSTILYMSVLLIPPIDNSHKNFISSNLTCVNDDQLLLVTQYSQTCNEKLLNQVVEYEFNCDGNISVLNKGTFRKVTLETSNLTTEGSGHSSYFLLLNSTKNLNCSCDGNNKLYNIKTKLNPSSCFHGEEIQSSIYNTFQFWMILLLVVFGSTGYLTVGCLNDAACYEMLGDKPQLYGRQRLWGTIGWGITTLLTGFLNDISTGTSESKDYSPGFYLLLSFLTIDLFLLFKLKLKKTSFSINICKDVRTAFVSFEMVLFSLGVCFIGIFSSFISNYEFWYLQDMGATQTLCGLAVAIQCLASEVPFFYFSGWFIQTFGHFYCLSSVFLAFALRFGSYFFITNPWHVLPIDLLHGITYGIYQATMTNYASSNAPTGTEATILGIMGALYDAGIATGSLLGGVGVDKFGGRHTFLVAGLISLLCVPVLLIFSFFRNKSLDNIKIYNIDGAYIDDYNVQVSEEKI